MKTPKERSTPDLLELVVELHARGLNYPSKEMHDAYWEARRELERRIGANKISNKMNKEEEKIFREIVAKDCKRMAQENNVAWCGISLYLDGEHDKGKSEFRLVVNDDKSFYIHPLGKDGETYDGKL